MISRAFRCMVLTILVGILHTACLASGDTTRLVVSIRQGRISGIVQDSTWVWKGIPYAKPPVGDLRFRAPQLPDTWTGVRDAANYGSVAPQSRRTTNEKIKRNEDCLYLNVWSPAADGRKRPVMVWIHGGGFLVGSGASPLYNGAHLAHNGDVVVVTINYRLGALGFLYLDDIKGGQTGFDDNLGIRDQVAALQWVHDNIAAFGGDPEAVTVFGESAGGISVLTLLATPSAHGLFKRAIVESGPPGALFQPKTATALTQHYLKILGVSPDSLSKLKSVKTDSFVSVMDRLVRELMRDTGTVKIFSPTIDGHFITSDPLTAIREGKAAGIDLMIGTNHDEATLLSLKRIGLTPRNAAQLEPYLNSMGAEGRKRLIKVYKKYPHKKGVLAMTTDGIFAMPSIEVASVQSSYAPTYMYRFDWSSFPLRLLGLRACHGLELPFVFGTFDRNPGKFFTTLSNRKIVRSLSQQIQMDWVNFARYGNPDPSGVNGWAKYTASTRPTMIFARKVYTMSDPRSEQRAAWAGLSIFK